MEKQKVGIIVGRFQVPSLHDGHKYLIDKALANCDKLFIFLGVTKNEEITERDPLPFEAREKMIIDEYPNLYGHIYPMKDIGNWPEWVIILDTKIQNILSLNGLNDSIVYIFGSRDSVATRYKEFGGAYQAINFEPWKGDGAKSGTEVRRAILANYHPEWTQKERSLMVYLVLNKIL